jgi:O-antigen ligase
MTADIDWQRVAAGGAFGFAAILCGLAAGVEPLASIFVALAIVYMVVAVTDLSAGLSIFVFASFVSMYAYSLYDVAARTILILAWLMYVMTRRRKELDFQSVHPWAAAALILFVGWCYLSTAWSEDTGKALLSATEYALSALLMVVTYTAVQTKRDLGRVLTAFLFGACAAIIYALISPAASEEGRLANVVLGPNVLGEALVCGLAIGVALIVMYPSPARRVANIAATLFVGVGVLLTTSRSALIALVASLVAAVLLAGRWRMIALCVTLVLAGGTYIYFKQFAPTSARDRVEAPLSSSQRSSDGRNTIWSLAVRAFEDQPLTGVGAGNFRVVQRRYLLRPGVDRARTQFSEVIDDPHGKVAHNSFLSVASELGIVGLVLFVLLIGFAAASLLKAASLFKKLGDGRMQVVSICLVVAMVGSLGVQMFQSQQQEKVIWLLLGLGPALLTIARSEARERGLLPAPRRARASRRPVPAYSPS